MNTTNTTNTTPAPAWSVEIAIQLTRQTGEQWTASDAGGNAFLTRAKDGLNLWISNPQWRSANNRHEIHWTPKEQHQQRQFWSGGEQHSAETITVSATKTPERIAADIIKRVMTNAEKMQTLLQEHIARAERWELVRESDKTSAATVWTNGTWHTWDENGTGGENASEPTVEQAKRAAALSAHRQGFI